MKYTCLALSLLLACAKKADAPAPSTVVTVTGTLRNLFHPTADGLAPATSTELAAFCDTTLALQVKIYNVLTFTLSPSAANPVTTCLVSPTDGTFSCPNLDQSQDTIAMTAIFDDVDNSKSDCIIATSSILIPCSLTNFQDPTNTLCGSGHALDDHIIDEKETLSASVIAKKIFDGFDAQLAADPATIGPLSTSGGILSAVVDAKGNPVADALPYLPLTCQSSLTCRALIVALDDNGAPTLDLTAQKTNALGMWLAQVEQKDASGNLTPVKADVNSLQEPRQGYGATDCSGATPPACFSPFPSEPISAGERPADASGAASSAVVSLSIVTQTAADATGQCPVAADLVKAGASTTSLNCP